MNLADYQNNINGRIQAEEVELGALNDILEAIRSVSHHSSISSRCEAPLKSKGYTVCYEKEKNENLHRLSVWSSGIPYCIPYSSKIYIQVGSYDQVMPVTYAEMIAVIERNVNQTKNLIQKLKEDLSKLPKLIELNEKIKSIRYEAAEYGFNETNLFPFLFAYSSEDVSYQ